MGKIIHFNPFIFLAVSGRHRYKNNLFLQIISTKAGHGPCHSGPEARLISWTISFFEAENGEVQYDLKTWRKRCSMM